MKLRARLDRANGHHDNQITWTWNNGVPIVGVGPPADIELQVVPADRQVAVADRGRQARHPQGAQGRAQQAARRRRRLLRRLARPGGARDAVAPGNQQITDPGQCNSLYPSYSLTRPAAGAPATDDIVQCALGPIDPEDYLPATLSDAQLATLRATFPNGVCDYTKPAVGQQHSIPWMTYEDGPGGKPLGPAPRSVAVLPAVRSASRRGARARAAAGAR